MDVHNNNSTSTSSSTRRRPEHSSVLAHSQPQDLTKCVSMVEGSSLPSGGDDDAVIAAPPEATTNDESLSLQMGAPAEIPPDTKPSGSEANEGEVGAADDDDDWGDEDSYEYEDDEDVAFSGFLAPTAAATSGSRSASVEPARIVEEEQKEEPAEAATATAAAAAEASKRKWKEPTREAVNMSLRAQSESTGGKRRLALDLYKIMNQDTEEAGFSLQPKSEDSMDIWTIKLFQFDEDSNLAKDMKVLGIDHIELEMRFPDQYPFEPPFVRVVRPRFKRQTGFVMNGALCMELLTKEGWNPINDIESVIVSIRSLLVVGDGRLQAAAELTEARYEQLLEAANETSTQGEEAVAKQSSSNGETDADAKNDDEPSAKRARVEDAKPKPVTKEQVGSYTASEAQSAYSHLSDYHKKKGWDTSGWWARKG